MRRPYVFLVINVGKMSSVRTVTTRKIKNTITGIDISVPTVKEKVGRLLTDEEFQVIVITSNDAFKQTPDDSNVQFMVPKRYNQFEALHRALGEKFPATILPELPRKLLMMKDSTLSERRSAFDKLMNAIAQNPKICYSSIVLTFLGLSKEQIKKAEEMYSNPSKETNGINKMQPATEKKNEKHEEVNLFVDFEDQEDDTLFGGSTSKPDITETISHSKKFEDLPSADNDLLRLMREADPKPEKPKLKVSSLNLFDDRDPLDNEDADIFIAVDTTDRAPSHDLSSAYEDNSELLNIDDDIDKLFLDVQKKKPAAERKQEPDIALKTTVSNKPALANKPKIATKPNLPSKPMVSKKPASKPTVASKPSVASKPGTKQEEIDAKSIGKMVVGGTDITSLTSAPGERQSSKPSTSNKSNITQSKYDDLFAETPNMDQDDIMAYILNNSGTEEATLDLF